MIKIAKKNDFTDSILTQLIEFARKDVDEILAQLGTNREGLTSEEAQDRLEMYGLNEIAHEKPAPWYIQLIKAFINPFIGILVFLAIVSYITDVLFTAPQDRDWSTIIIISIMVTVSGLLRFVQEYRSNVEAEKLKALVYTTAAVIRKDTGEKEIKIEEIVPGDIIHLAAGDMVPADVRVITSKDLFINQATLTGESEPVEKYPDLKEEKRKAKDLSLSDLENICFMGTNVVSGSAIAVVLSTGDRTYFGSMTKSLVGHRVMTSFERGINNVSKVLIKFMTCLLYTSPSPRD